MLKRLLISRNQRFFVRCLSDKSKDDTSPPENTKVQEKDKKQSNEILDLLKSMAQASESKTKSKETNNVYATAPGIKKIRPEPNIIERKEDTIEQSISEAAAKVAESLGGDVEKTESELLSKVQGKFKLEPTNLSELIKGMKIERTERKPREDAREWQVKRAMARADKRAEHFSGGDHESRRDGQGQQRRKSFKRTSLQAAEKVDIMSGERLGIFSPTETPDYGPTLETWEALKQRELALATSQPPANYFQKMVLWTEQGKVWKYPIDNEQGLEEEQKVHFSEHVFIDQYLEDWCPKKGPIRHFMELVCVGLSKNPFYTAQEKKDHIMWYKDYFESKRTLLEEIGAYEKAPRQEKPETS